MERIAHGMDTRNARLNLVKEALFFNATSIFGPLLAFGGAGWLLDQELETGKKFLFAGIAIAFVTTNILMARKVRQFLRMSRQMSRAASEERK